MAAPLPRTDAETIISWRQGDDTLTISTDSPSIQRAMAKRGWPAKGPVGIGARTWIIPIEAMRLPATRKEVEAAKRSGRNLEEAHRLKTVALHSPGSVSASPQPTLADKSSAANPSEGPDTRQSSPLRRNTGPGRKMCGLPLDKPEF